MNKEAAKTFFLLWQKHIFFPPTKGAFWALAWFCVLRQFSNFFEVCLPLPPSPTLLALLPLSNLPISSRASSNALLGWWASLSGSSSHLDK